MNLKKAFFLFTSLISCITFFWGCENDAVKPKPTGSIKAVVSPAGAVTKMQLSKSADIITILPQNGDTFLAENLEDGPYLVSFWKASYFNEEYYTRTITIKNGQAIVLDTLKFTRQDTTKPGTMSATINDIKYIFDINHAEWIGSTLWISGFSHNVGSPYGSKDIGIALQQVTGPGIFSSPSYAGIGLSGFPPVSLLWATNVSGGNLTVNLTKFDTINNRLSGEFSFKAIHITSPGSYTPQTVTKGIFTDVLIK
ncbi:hypothetical protein [Adhaeribacter terreus]|uniref:Carboxypeptidase regulatory-like domain-containing protein n=1 Tax=Adhaeribacter terreus TaxID=529703 RepID=A0ABW0EBG1_9BACT